MKASETFVSSLIVFSVLILSSGCGTAPSQNVRQVDESKTVADPNESAVEVTLMEEECDKDICQFSVHIVKQGSYKEEVTLRDVKIPSYEMIGELPAEAFLVGPMEQKRVPLKFKHVQPFRKFSEGGSELDWVAYLPATKVDKK